MFNNKYKKQIKKLYQNYFNKDLNYTSLVVYHAPIIPQNKSGLSYLYGGSFYYRKWVSKRLGTMLNGDLYLQDDGDYQPYFNYFTQSYFDRCDFFQVPHHGSSANWRFFPNGLQNIKFYIINHGLGRKHHPGIDVINDIMQNSSSKHIALNNEAHSLNYILISK